MAYCVWIGWPAMCVALALEGVPANLFQECPDGAQAAMTHLFAYLYLSS